LISVDNSVTESVFFFIVDCLSF